MSANKIKITYNSFEKSATYQFMSDKGRWVDVYSGSELSRKKYRTSISEGRINELFDVIDKNYNIENCGVKIFFSGDIKAFEKIKEIASSYNGISIMRCESRNVIIGKRNSGKTFLAQGIFNNLGKTPIINETEIYIEYKEKDSDIHIFEIKGIDFGLENVNKAYEMLKNCINDGARTVFYCFLAKTGKIEEVEIDFIKRIEDEFSELNIIPVITGCIDERKGSEFARKIKDELGERDVFITLAKEMNTKVGLIPTFGLDQLIKNLAGGNV